MWDMYTYQLSKCINSHNQMIRAPHNTGKRLENLVDKPFSYTSLF